MAHAFTELLVENGQASAGGGDAPGSVRVRNASRRFLVPAGPGGTPALAALNAQLLAEAGAGVQYPGIPGLVSVGYQIGGRLGPDENGDVAYYAEAQYAPEGTPQFDFPTPDRQSLTFISAGFTNYEREIPFPIMSRQAISAPFIGVGPNITSDRWVENTGKKLLIKGMSFQIEFNTTELGSAQIGAIFAQAGKIHTFYGGDWIFKPQRADKIFRDGVWNVVYRWEGERGTSAEELSQLAADPAFCPVEARPAHADWYVVWDRPPLLTAGQPRLIARRTRELVPSGHHTLPGYGSSWNL